MQLMQKSLTQMNLLVHKAATDITGVTGMKIIDAIVSGQTDPNVLTSFRDQRCKKDEKPIAKARNGNFRRERLFTLKQAYVIWKLLRRRQIIDCDQEIEPLLREMNHDPSEAIAFKPKHNPKQNQIVFNLRDYLKSLCGVDLTEVPGVDEIVALTVISELCHPGSAANPPQAGLTTLVVPRRQIAG